GRARRVEYRGALLDNGQHVLLGAYHETLALMREVGAAASAMRRFPLTLVFPQRLRLAAPRLPAPLHLAAAIAAAQGLTWRERGRMIAFTAWLRRRDFQLDAGLTVAALLEQRAQTGAARELVWGPLCVSALNTPVDEADAQVFANVLRDALFGARADSD